MYDSNNTNTVYLESSDSETERRVPGLGKKGEVGSY